MDTALDRAANHFVTTGVAPGGFKYVFGKDINGRFVTFHIVDIHREDDTTFLLLIDSEGDYMIVPIQDMRGTSVQVVTTPAPPLKLTAGAIIADNFGELKE